VHMSRSWLSIALAAALVSIAPAHAAEKPEGMMDSPCPSPLAMPPEARALLSDLFIRPRVLRPQDFQALGSNRSFAPYERELRARGATDWPGLCRFREANRTAVPGSTEVVFIGDSITENWNLADPEFFSDGLVNRGIGAQTSAQLLVRFRADVVALHPAIVHLLIGTNDVAGNNGPIAADDFQRNVESMVEIARANGIRVVLGSIPPSAAFAWRPAMRPAARIVELNAWLRDYARRNGLGFIDYHKYFEHTWGSATNDLATVLANKKTWAQTLDTAVADTDAQDERALVRRRGRPRAGRMEDVHLGKAGDLVAGPQHADRRPAVA